MCIVFVFVQWPNIVSILLGVLLTILFVYGMCVPVLSRTGRFDIFTEVGLRCKRGQEEESPLVQLKQDTIWACSGEQVGEHKSLWEKGQGGLDYEEHEEHTETTDKVDFDLAEEGPVQEEEEIQEA